MRGPHSAETKAKISVGNKARWAERKAAGIRRLGGRVAKPKTKVIQPKPYITLATLRTKRAVSDVTRGRMAKARRDWWRRKRRKDRAEFDWDSVVRGQHRGVNQYARMSYPLAGWKMMACRMSPGRVYERAELNGLLPDAPKSSVSPWLSQWLVAGGYVERLPHPDYQGGKPGAFGWHREIKNPRWLYRLTEGGCVARRGWLAALAQTGVHLIGEPV